MREKLLDVIKHTSGLGFIEAVKVTGTEDSTVFEAMDNDRTVIIRAELKQPEPELAGEFGIRNLGILQGLLNHAPYRADDATLTITSKERSGVTAPEFMTLATANGKDKSDFRFMSASLLPAVAQLKHKTWDVDITPTDSKIQEFASLASIYASVEQYFGVVTKDGNLQFLIGDPNGASHSASMTFAEDIEGTIKSPLYWPVNQVLTILKAGKNEQPKVQVMAMGALQITLESEYATYSMILPAHKK